MQRIRTLLLEDEPHWQVVLGRMIEAHPLLDLVGKVGSPLEALPALSRGDIDLVMLDVEFAEINGIEFVKTLDKPPLVILVTTHDRFALKSYEIDTVDFLVKPVSMDRFLKAVEKAKRRLDLQVRSIVEFVDNETSAELEFFFVKEQNGYTKVRIEDIILVKSLENYIQIVTKETTHTTLASLNFIEGRLGPKFMRVHRSFLVGLQHIDSFNNEVVVAKGYDIPIGGQYLEQFKSEFVHRNVLKK
jgi:DNA-binding LytR/AlgR family response regulator